MGIGTLVPTPGGWNCEISSVCYVGQYLQLISATVGLESLFLREMCRNKLSDYIELSNYIELSDYIALSDYIELSDFIE